MFRSIVQRNLRNAECRDIMLKMMKLSQNFSFADIMGDLDDFESMISTVTAVVADILDCASFVET